MSAIETIKEQLPHLQAAEIAEVEQLIRELRGSREKQKSAAKETMGSLAGSGRTVDDFLEEKHTAGERW
jgi:hypothetical protein